MKIGAAECGMRLVPSVVEGNVDCGMKSKSADQEIGGPRRVRGATMMRHFTARR